MTVLSRVRVSAFTLALVAAAFQAPLPAMAQEAVAFVNGQPITSYDVEQRMRINRAAGGKGADRKSALRDLIDDTIKINEARRIGYRLSESNLDDQVLKIATSNRQTLIEFSQALSKAGIDMNAYRRKLAAEYSWDLAVDSSRKAKFGATQTSDPIFARSEGGGVKVIDYSLTSVIFIVPPGSSPGQRSRDAAAARGRFAGCAAGLEELRNTRDVALRPSIRRSSNGLNPKLAELLAKTPVDKLTPPMPSDQGIEMIAVCEKTERLDRTAKTDAEKADTAKKNAAFEEEYMKTLRAKAVIQYR